MHLYFLDEDHKMLMLEKISETIQASYLYTIFGSGTFPPTPKLNLM